MPITKDDLRLNESDYYEDIILDEQPILHTVTEEEASDPGRIALAFGYTHEQFKIILRYNGLIDPFDEVVPGFIMNIPSLQDIQKLRKI